MLNEEEIDKPKKRWWKFEIKSLQPVEQPKNFWYLQKEDIFPCGAMFLMTLFVFAMSIIFNDIYAPLCYWDGPNYLYAAKSLYNVPVDNPWGKYLSYPQYYLACHLPGYPLAIRAISIFFFNIIPFGYAVSIFIIPVLLVYMFRRVLVLFDCVEDTEWTAMLFSVIPLRFIIYHSVGASEPFFMLMASLAIIFFKLNETKKMCLCVSACLMTRVEGLIVWGTIGLCCLLVFDIKRAFCTGLCLITFGLIILFHRGKFGYWNAYLKYNQGNQKMINKMLFQELIRTSKYSWNDMMYESDLYLSIPFLISILCCYSRCIPYAIHGTAYFIFISFINHLDVMRYSLPGIAPAILIGLDPFFSSKSFKATAKISLPILVALGVFYATCQIGSNRAPYFFYKEIIDSPTYYY